MNFDTFYTNFCNDLRCKNLVEEFCSKMKESKSDYDRIGFLLDQTHLQVVTKELNGCIKPCFEQKNNDTSSKLLNQAKALPSSNNFRKAVLLNKALMYLEKFSAERSVPPDNFVAAVENYILSEVPNANKDFSMQTEIMLEKAILLSETKNHAGSLTMLMFVIRNLGGLEDSKLQFEGILLLGELLKSLNHVMEATSVAGFALKFLKLKFSKDKEFQCKKTVIISQLLKQLKSMQAKDVSPDLLIPPETKHKGFTQSLFIGENSVITGASDAIQLATSDNKGRCAIAKCEIPVGSTIILENPYAWSLDDELTDQFCSHCFTDIVEADIFPCESCASMCYCSIKCREKAHVYHRYECNILGLLTGSETLGKMSLICYRTMTLTPVETLLTCWKQNEPEKLDSSSYSSVYVQATNSHARKPGDLLKRAVSAIYMILCLKFTEKISSSNPLNSSAGINLKQDERILASLALRHFQSLSCNAYGINHVRLSMSQDSVAEIGGGTFPVISITNHSCDPNVYRYYDGIQCIVRTIKPIKVGEEIFDCYGPRYNSQIREKRQEYLKTQYLFECCCPPCERSGPWFSQESKNNEKPEGLETLSVKCPCCSELFSFSNANRRCRQCNHDLKKVKRKLQGSFQKFKEEKNKLFHLIKSKSLQWTETHKLLESIELTTLSYMNTLCQLTLNQQVLFLEAEEVLKLCWNLIIAKY